MVALRALRWHLQPLGLGQLPCPCAVGWFTGFAGLLFFQVLAFGMPIQSLVHGAQVLPSPLLAGWLLISIVYVLGLAPLLLAAPVAHTRFLLVASCSSSPRSSPSSPSRSLCRLVPVLLLGAVVLLLFWQVGVVQASGVLFFPVTFSKVMASGVLFFPVTLSFSIVLTVASGISG